MPCIHIIQYKDLCLIWNDNLLFQYTPICGYFISWEDDKRTQKIHAHWSKLITGDGELSRQFHLYHFVKTKCEYSSRTRLPFLAHPSLLNHVKSYIISKYLHPLGSTCMIKFCTYIVSPSKSHYVSEFFWIHSWKHGMQSDMVFSTPQKINYYQSSGRNVYLL